ncbi:MAG: hypothetical protein QOI68_4850, partial [Pseudonocardiales bacterium]|nr:hypothetical protein [Pseudonocardiales bacterium]
MHRACVTADTSLPSADPLPFLVIEMGRLLERNLQK